ncbi:unnamed protein product, partial [Polarella glacialis]
LQYEASEGGRASSRRQLGPSSSHRELRSPDVASVRSRVSSTRSQASSAMRHSQSAGAIAQYAPRMPLNATPWAPPPAPSIPGSNMGSVYSRARS